MGQQQETSLQDKVCHLAYRADGYYDLVNNLSPEGYELLNDGFAAYLDQMQPTVDKDKPVVMQIVASGFTPEQKEAVDRATWSHYRLRLSEANMLMRKLRVKTFWFAVSFALSSLLLFLAGSNLEEVFVQFLYLPFYFFGYRVITYPIFDYLPEYRRCKQLAQMASMYLMFTDEPLPEVPDEHVLKALECERTYKELARKGTADNRMVREFFVEEDIVVIECPIQGIEDVVSPNSVPGHELLSADMAGYLEQVEPFVTRKSPVSMLLTGGDLNEREEAVIRAAIGHHYGLRIADAREASHANWHRALVFALCMIAASVTLYLWGAFLDVVAHECVIIALWFFADYLIEFVLLEGMSLRLMRQKWENLQKMGLQVRQGDR